MRAKPIPGSVQPPCFPPRLRGMTTISGRPLRCSIRSKTRNITVPVCRGFIWRDLTFRWSIRAHRTKSISGTPSPRIITGFMNGRRVPSSAGVQRRNWKAPDCLRISWLIKGLLLPLLIPPQLMRMFWMHIKKALG